MCRTRCWCEEESSGNRQKSCQILNSGAVKRPKQRRDLLLLKRFFASRSSAEDTRRSRRRLRGLEEEQTRLCGMCGDVEPTCFSRGRRDLSMDKPRPPGRGPALVTPTAPKSGWS